MLIIRGERNKRSKYRERERERPGTQPSVLVLTYTFSYIYISRSNPVQSLEKAERQSSLGVFGNVGPVIIIIETSFNRLRSAIYHQNPTLKIPSITFKVQEKKRLYL